MAAVTSAVSNLAHTGAFNTNSSSAALVFGESNAGLSLANRSSPALVASASGVHRVASSMSRTISARLVTTVLSNVFAGTIANTLDARSVSRAVSWTLLCGAVESLEPIEALAMRSVTLCVASS